MKNFDLRYEGYESYLIDKVPYMEGYQYIFGFPNGYGASVIKHRGSYGFDSDKWELAVIKFGEGGKDDWNLCYDTLVTDDVIGYLTDEDVTELFRQIMEL